MREAVVHIGLSARILKFQLGPPLVEGPVDFLFAGQFIARKGIAGPYRALQNYAHKQRSSGSAVIWGRAMSHDLELAAIDVYSFAEAEAVARPMRKARFLVSPSAEDHWGVVVHEAALSGCGLIKWCLAGWTCSRLSKDSCVSQADLERL